ncbi:SMP-30/gluconolactonase/LRE family protein [Candidatus Kaiserbacteria bacterium]|nr:SMP-30/gluconolactonase/LRE family protein [Candidatus Kaiserbacteria bacterium]
MKRAFTTAAVIVVVMIAYLCLWPVPIEPKAWSGPVTRGYTGAHAANNKLGSLKTIALQGEQGPEHLAVGKDGKLYAAMDSGAILRMSLDGSTQEEFTRHGGRVLGFDFDASGNLIAADATKGLLSISPDKTITVLADRVEGQPIRYANSVVVAGTGKVYFTDSSTRFSPAQTGTFLAGVYDMLEQSCTGRVLEFDPATRSMRVLARGLCFANGVALGSDGQSLFVNETGKFRIWKIAMAANGLDVNQPSPLAKVLLDNLPGYPDNLMRGLEGRIWVGFVKPRNPILDKLADKPFLRKLIVRLPRAWWPIPKVYGHVMAFSEDGKVLMDLQDPSGAYPETSGVTETADRLFIQSLHAKTLGWLPR